MRRIDHVQSAIPPGAEDGCRRFYVDLLGMEEVAKPPVLAARGGVWLKRGEVQIHLDVEADFHPARKAHPAILVEDLDGLGTVFARAWHEPLWDLAIPDVRRFYVSDPVGNRLEFMEA